MRPVADQRLSVGTQADVFAGPIPGDAPNGKSDSHDSLDRLLSLTQAVYVPEGENRGRNGPHGSRNGNGVNGMTVVDTDCSTVRIPSADGAEIDTWLYRPVASTVRGVVAMAPGIGGVKAAGTLIPFAERFRDNGFACLVFDYRHWGSSDGTPRGLLSVRRELEDYRAVLRWAEHNPDFRGVPRFVWGTSFGGMHAIEVAASDPGIAGAIAQCPAADGLAGARGIKLRQTLKLTRLAIADLVGSWMGREPIYVPIAAPPGEIGIITTDDGMEAFDYMMPGDWPNEITARSVLDMPMHRPVRRARRIRCPILIVVVEHDSMLPIEPAVRVAAEAPRGELFRSRGGHYEVYAGGPDHENILRAETEFLRRHAEIEGETPVGQDLADFRGRR